MIFDNDHYIYSLRRNSEMALEDKLRRNSDGGTFGLVEEAMNAFIDNVLPDTQEHCLNPFTALSSSASSSPQPEPRESSMNPEQCANDVSDSDSDDDKDPYAPECRQRYELEQMYFVQNGMVYERSMLNCPSEDAPFVPTTPAHEVSKFTAALILPSEDDEVGVNPLLLSEDSSTRLTSPSPESQPVCFTPYRRASKRHPDTFKVLQDDDEDDRNPTDDEYCPSPPPPTRKKARVSGGNSRRIVSRGSCVARSTCARPRTMPQSRNTQSTSSTFLKAVNKKSVEDCDFTCPECGWKQENRRMPDYQRHLRTHARPSNGDQSRGWWCKGVPVEEQHKYPIPADAKTYYFQDRQRIGGCLLTFSRRDALKRHLDNPNVSCVGQPCPANCEWILSP